MFISYIDYFIYNYNPALLILHISFSICLLLHWYCNSDTCSLTIDPLEKGQTRNKIKKCV
jgi:hypothetical protein